MKRPAVTVFAGPSSCGLPPALRTAASCWLPPARRGDIDRVVDGGGPAVLVLCDGVFDAVPAVSHAELCRALDSGWEVWGVSSLGAIRAWEMRGEGMRGYGRVYSMFERLPDFSDDEMCLLHCPEEPFFAVTEALVNVRVALEEHGPPCGIDARTAKHLVERLQSLWFGDRSEAAMRRILVEESGIDAEAAQRWLESLRGSRIKNRDLAKLLRAQPWRQALTG